MQIGNDHPMLLVIDPPPPRRAAPTTAAHPTSAIDEFGDRAEDTIERADRFYGVSSEIEDLDEEATAFPAVVSAAWDSVF
jgi:hypothetical protein